LERTLGQQVIAGVTYLRYDETRPGSPRQNQAAFSVPPGIVTLDALDAS
jgi:hypothetical protein